jgi:hypothetical protein
MHTKVWSDSLKGRDDSEHLGVGRIILKWILGESGLGVVDWIHVAQNRDSWQVLVNTVRVA